MLTQKKREIDSYFESGVYKDAGVPFRITEPRYTTNTHNRAKHALDSLNREITIHALEGLNQGSTIMMCGGCNDNSQAIIEALQRYYGEEIAIGMVWVSLESNKTNIQGVNVIELDILKDWKEDIKEYFGKVDVVYLHIDSDIFNIEDATSNTSHQSDKKYSDDILNTCIAVLDTSKVSALSLISEYKKGESKKRKEEKAGANIQVLSKLLSKWNIHPVISI